MYTYLVSSLPTLVMGNPPPFRGDDFLFRLQGVLPDFERAQVAAILAGNPVGGSPFAEAWQSRETQMRNAIVRARASVQNLDARGMLRGHPGFDVSVSTAVVNAFAKEDPLERELDLDRCRWHLAEELAWPDMFGFGAVLAFAVKLRIVSRWADMNDKTGTDCVETFIEKNTAAGKPAA